MDRREIKNLFSNKTHLLILHLTSSMKTNHISLFGHFITLTIFLLCFPYISLAQDKENTLQSYEILSTAPYGKPTFIDFITTKVNTDEKSVYSFLKNTYNFDENTTFKTYLEKPFFKNGSFIRKQNQYYKGHRVEFGQVTITYKNNTLLSLGTNIIPIQDYNPVILISENDALKVALQDIGAKEYAWQSEFEQSSLQRRTQNPNATYYPKGELVIIDKSYFDNSSISTFALAYVFTIQSSQPFAIKRYYVDATTGEILHKGSTLCHVTGDANTTRYSGKRQIETERMDDGRYRLHDATRRINTLDVNLSLDETTLNFTDNDNDWTTTEHQQNHDDAALDAHWGASVTYDYFQNVFSRNGWNNQGGALENRVHTNFSNLPNDRNASWSNGVIRYGDGNGDDGERASPMTALDIVAHEIAHGIVQTSGSTDGTNSIIYDTQIINLRESVSIQEGLSDIWAAMVEYDTDPTKETYIAMDEITTMPNDEKRNLANPKDTGNPDTYGEINWLPTTDYFSIHRNSTIMSHWFYILAEGDDGINDLGNSYDVTGIGKQAAAEFLYQAQVGFKTYMTFVDVRNTTVLAAINKWGRNSDEAKAVCQAWYAVGVGGEKCFFRGGGDIVGVDGNGDPTGDDVGVFCNPNIVKTYYLIGVDPNANVVWNVSPNLEKDNDTNTSVEVQVNSSNVILGHAYLSATIDGTVVYYHDIWIGLPQVEISHYQVNPNRIDIRLVGANGTDVYKQGITNVNWQLTNTTGSCIPSLTVTSPINFLATLDASCTNWSAQVEAIASNECGDISAFENFGVSIPPIDPSDPIIPLPCPRYVVVNGIVTIFHCQGIEPDDIISIDIHNYMGIRKAIYKDTDSFSTHNLPIGLYFIKVQTQKGQLFTLKYIKQ